MPTEPNPDTRRVIFTEDGPALIEGPVELVTADGATVCSDRFQVAICLCRRSKNYPLCDTSHRKHRRPRVD
ncbi:CDGSH iron-sulfur domain-containing protein [Nocardia sp. NPDC049220]|uniref:CDGSH iron-sulfur domain-containing protein n=1 Tax=Nocardia sp. NPDC049220 TaxID=3155273 RepID=UPI003400884A